MEFEGGTECGRGHKWHNMVVKWGRRMTGVGYTGWHCSSPYFLAELPLRLPADAAPSHPLIDYAAKRRIYISIRSSFDPGRTRPSLETLITVGLIGARHYACAATG